MRVVRSAGFEIVAMALALAACGSVGPDRPAAEVCADQATEQGGTLVASFVTTVGSVVRIAAERESREAAAGRPHQGAPRRFTGLSPDGAAILCYFDDVSIGIPYPSGEPEPRPWDRIGVAVVGGTADVVMVGYREQLQIQAP